MTEFNYRVEQQRLKIEAEKWANGIKLVHSHSLDSCWYATGRTDGSVQDIMFNDGRVQRTINSTNEVIMIGEQITGENLITAYSRGGI